MDSSVDFLILGAGMAGLSCAQALQQAGKKVLVLERSQAVGGRCALRCLTGDPRPLDFGPVFVHGDDPEFLTWAQSAAPDLIPGWPRKVRGTGTPCQPEAFGPGTQRFALTLGMRSLAENLAQGLEVELQQEIIQLTWSSGGFTVTAQTGRQFQGRNLVLAAALEQSAGLLQTLEGPSARSAGALLAQFASTPSLTLLASYPASLAPLDWDLWFPETSPAILLISNEASKRPHPPLGPLLVLQARGAWSAERLETPKEQWTQELLAAAAELLGPWAAQPLQVHPHRWKYGRLTGSQHLAESLVLQDPHFPGHLALTGDLFAPEGGVQGAWRAGRLLAQRLLKVI